MKDERVMLARYHSVEFGGERFCVTVYGWLVGRGPLGWGGMYAAELPPVWIRKTDRSPDPENEA